MIKKLYNDVFNDIQTTYVKGDFKYLLKRLFSIMLDQFIDITYIYKLDLDKIEYIPPPFEGLEFEIMTSHHLDSIFREHMDEINEKEYLELQEKFKDSSHNGFILKKDNEIYGYCFIKFRTGYPLLITQYMDERNNGHLWNDRVFKKYRNQKIHQYSIYNRLQILTKQNYITATVSIHNNNYPSERAYEKFGFKKFAISYNFQFGKWMKTKENYKLIKHKKIRFSC